MRPTAQEALSMFDRYVAEGKSHEGAMAYVVGWVEANAWDNKIEELVQDAEGWKVVLPASVDQSESVGSLADWIRAQGGEE